MEFVEKQDLQEPKESPETGEIMKEAEPGEPLTGEKSAMEKIGEDIEEEQKEESAEAEILKKNKEALENIEEKEEEEDPFETDEEKEKRILKKADSLIKRETEKLKTPRKDWKKCPKCNRRPIAPWNTKGMCSTCQRKRKTNRPYKRKS